MKLLTILAALPFVIVGLFIWPSLTGVLVGAYAVIKLAEPPTIGGMFIGMFAGAFFLALPANQLYNYNATTLEFQVSAVAFIGILLWGMFDPTAGRDPDEEPPAPNDTLPDDEPAVQTIEVINTVRDDA